MIQVFAASWALFLGMFLLMIGNGLQGTLLGRARGPRAGVCGTWLAHFGGADPVSRADRALGLGAGPCHHRVLLLRGVYHRRKLAERCVR